MTLFDFADIREARRRWRCCPVVQQGLKARRWREYAATLARALEGEIC